MNTGLTLRTVRLHDGVAEVRAGATLLYDSVADAEDAECRLKASALLACLSPATHKASPTLAIPRVDAVEPPHGQREITVYAPNVPLPAVVVSYPQPAATDPDIPVLAVLDAIMARGESSRLYHAMVYDQQIANTVFTNFESTKDPGAYSLAAILAEGKTVDEGLTSLEAEIARVRDGGVTQAELDEAKNEIVSSTLEQRETAYGRAFELADSVIRYGDAAYADRLLAAVQAATVADVQRVARRIFDDSHRTIIRYQSDEARPAGVTGEGIATSSTIQASALTIPASEIPVFTLLPAAMIVLSRRFHRAGDSVWTWLCAVAAPALRLPPASTVSASSREKRWKPIWQISCTGRCGRRQNTASPRARLRKKRRTHEPGVARQRRGP